MCSYFLSGEEIITTLGRADGKRLYGKEYWTMEAIRKRIASLKKQLKKWSSVRTSGNEKKLLQAKSKLRKFQKAKRLIAKCAGMEAPPPQPPPEGERVRFEHVRPLIEAQCMNCHGVLGWRNEEAFYLESGKVVPGKLDLSSFYTFLSGNPDGYLPAYMPKGLAPLSADNIKLLRRWILDLGESSVPVPPTAPPTPDPGPPWTPEELEGRELYTTFCSSCHGAFNVSTKFGATEEQIRNALGQGGIPQMRFLNLTDEQIRRIALALGRVSPPQEGSLSITAPAAMLEGGEGEQRTLQFAVRLNGATSEPFSVGFVTTNGSALADSDFAFAAGTLDFSGQDGETKIITVEIIGDTFQESDETLFVDIGGVTHAGVRIEASTSMGTIANDDTLSAPQVLPPLAGNLRLAYGFNGDFRDARGVADAVPEGGASISGSSKVGGGALLLDNSLDYIKVPGHSLQGSTSFTFAAWVFWEDNGAQSNRIFDFGSSTTDFISFSPRSSSNRYLFEVRARSGTYFSVQAPTVQALPSGRWVHLATTLDTATDEMKIFIDGQQTAARTGVTSEFSLMSLSDSRIGKSRVTTSSDFAGRVDEVMVWDTALSQAQIQEAMAMQESVTINSGLEVRLAGQPIADGSTLDLGSIDTGNELNVALSIHSRGLSSLGLVDSPNVRIGGRDKTQFSVELQPWPWQQMIDPSSFAVFTLRYAPTEPGDKLATMTIFNTDPAHGNYAAAIRASATGDALPEPEPPAEGGDDLEQGQYLYAMNCASCHGSLAQSQKLGATRVRLETALDPVAGIVQMRSLQLTAEQIDLIVLALNSPPPSSGEVGQVTNYTVRMGTAQYVVSVLEQVFLPEVDRSQYTTEDNTVLTQIIENVAGERINGTLIAGRRLFFGGSCQPRFDDRCLNENALLSHVPPPNAIRSGLLSGTCDRITGLDRAINNALLKIGRSSADPISVQATKDLHELFSPGHELPQYLAESIANFSSGVDQYDQKERWRFLINLLCNSHLWERQ